jgi:hypothetical protein
VVGRLRARLDRSAGRGIPAHVTVSYRFVPPGQVTPAVIEMAAAAVKSVPRLRLPVRRYGLVRRGCPLAGSRACRAVPGAHGRRARGLPAVSAIRRCLRDVIPHLTVGDRPEDGIGALRGRSPSASHAARPHACQPCLADDRHTSTWQLATAGRLPARSTTPSGMTGRSCTVCGRMRVSAETTCESVHKALPRKRRRLGGQDYDDRGQPCPRHESASWGVMFSVARCGGQSAEMAYRLDDDEAERGGHQLVAVGTVLADGPPRRSQRAELPHWAPVMGTWRRTALRAKGA